MATWSEPFPTLIVSIPTLLCPQPSIRSPCSSTRMAFSAPTGLDILSDISANRFGGRCVSIGSEGIGRGGQHTLVGRPEEVTWVGSDGHQEDIEAWLAEGY